MLQTIERQPELFPVVYRTARRALLDRFPYAIYFVLTDAQIAGVAFLHGKQSRDDHLKGRA